MRVLVIAAHPDDETLGCGGTLLRHAERGDELFWVVVTQAHEPQWPAATIARKAVEVDGVAHAYGMKDTVRLGFPAARLDVVPQVDLMTAIREPIRRIQPEVVYLVHEGDVHSDHLATSRAATAVLKPFHQRALGVRRVLSYETLSSTDAAPPRSDRAFLPHVICDITPHMARKLEIMRMYESEDQGDLLPRGASAIEALARFRGATIGVKYAEAFTLVRELS